MRKLLALALVAAWPLADAAWADTVTLKDGSRHSGVFVAGTSQSITLRDRDGNRHRYDIRDVQSLDFSSSDVTNDQNDSRFDRNSRDDRSSDSRDRRVIPAGAEISVRTNETIDSRSTAEGRTYSAVIERDVLDDSGRLVIPKNSDAQLVIRRATSSDLVLDLQSVTVEGRRYLVSTTDLERKGRQGIGKNKRTAEMVGGGAVLGTLLGAIAGGGKGAAIGAIAGAGAGATAEVLTKGKEVKVPAETVLTFRLDRPLRLEAAS